MKPGDLVHVPSSARVLQKDPSDKSFRLFDVDKIQVKDSIGLILEVEQTDFSNKFYRVLLPGDRPVWILGTSLTPIQSPPLSL